MKRATSGIFGKNNIGNKVVAAKGGVGALRWRRRRKKEYEFFFGNPGFVKYALGGALFSSN
jgi:hypothetical protein